jgi:hypothetical protein
MATMANNERVVVIRYVSFYKAGNGQWAVIMSDYPPNPLPDGAVRKLVLEVPRELWDRQEVGGEMLPHPAPEAGKG